MCVKYHRTIGGLILLVALLLAILLMFDSNSAMAGAVKYTEGIKTKFTPSYRTHDGKVGSVECADTPRVCLDINSEKIVQGVKITRPCWQYGYGKTCQVYPSKNDCVKWRHCYVVADRECLTWDSYGNCVNIKKEFSCKRWTPITLDKEVVRTGFTAREGKERLVCKGVPCIDGNCVDQSYMTNPEMMDSVSKLSAVSQMKGVADPNFQLFTGFAQHCTKKAISYTNCCTTSRKGWGHNLGAKCNESEIDLVNKRQKNLCVYVGKENKQNMGITILVKHHYCCFGSLLNKVIQVEGRKQLRMNFGSNGRPNCRGLTLTEIMRLDFDRMDFSEFFADIVKRIQIPKIEDIKARIDGSLPKVRKYDGNPQNRQNKKAGINENYTN